MELERYKTIEKITDGGTHYVRELYTIGDYTVEVDKADYPDGDASTDISVSLPYTPGGRRSYLPEINYYDGFMGREKPRFKIQTPSFGALEIEEFKKFLEAYQTALDVAETLTRELLERSPEEVGE